MLKQVHVRTPRQLSRLSVSLLVSTHDLTVCEFEPRIGLSAVGVEPAWDSLSPSLSLPLPCLLCLYLCLSQNK